MQQAVQFGAGNIGRGFLGQLFYETGYHTTFIDVIDDVIEGLNKRHAYPLRIVGQETITISIGNASAVHASNLEAVTEAIAGADFGATAVGVPVLPRIAPALAMGLTRRFSRPHAGPLNLIICENLIGAGTYMREQVRAHLAPQWHAALDESVGFVEASIGRMVPVMTERERAEDPLLVCVEPYCELPVDARGFKGPIPSLKHMKPMDRFEAYVERKLFVHNMSHAVAAYLGHLRGHEYIWQAVSDACVRAEVEAALSETCSALAKRHGMDINALHAHGEDLLSRYANRALGDQVSRIAKDPIRKLGINDRLIGAGLMCLSQGIEPVHLALGAAAALNYYHPDDAGATRIQQLKQEQGSDAVLRDICGLESNSPLARIIREQETRLFKEGWLKHNG